MLMTTGRNMFYLLIASMFVLAGPALGLDVSPSSGSGRAGETVTISIDTSGEAIKAIDHSSGFASHSDLKENGSAIFTQNVARLTTGSVHQAGSIFSLNRVNIASFNTTFTFRLYGGSKDKADGICFVIQGNSPSALGPDGGGLGYGPDEPLGDPGIRNSICVKFDLFDNAGEGINSTGLFTDGRSPTVRRPGLSDSIPDRSVNLGGGVDLHNGNVKRVVLTYDGTTLNETITDTVTRATFNVSYPVNIRSFVNSDTAYVGFTGGTGDLTAIQDIQTWKFEGAPVIALSSTEFAFAGVRGGPSPASQTLTITNAGDGTLNWTATHTTENGGNWLSISPTSGTAPSTMTVSVNTSGMEFGNYAGTIRIDAPGAANTPQPVSVTLRIVCPNDGHVREQEDLLEEDAQLAFGFYLGRVTLTECQQNRADRDCNGEVTPNDALCIFKDILQLENPCPPCSILDQ